jgi:malonyl-CoA decarboxylase
MAKTKEDNRSAQEGIFNSTLDNLSRAWREIARLSRREGSSKDTRPDALRKRIEACLAGQGGEVSARGRAAGLARDYLDFTLSERLVFLEILAKDFGVEKAKVDTAIAALQHAKDEEEVEASQRALRSALEPKRVALLRKFNTLQSGPRFLVELRRELLELKEANPELRFLERDLKELLTAWFDVGFLNLRSINWNAPASLLEKLGRYEAVHRVRSWHDLKNRLETDRRCFAFFHPCMPEEPLIFVEIALVNGLARQIQGLLDEGAPILDADETDTAIFYSISNTLKGLAGIGFGNFLIKQVVDQLRHDQPNLKQFSTLSPIPGYMRWLMEDYLTQKTLTLNASEKKKLRAILGKEATTELLAGILASSKWTRDDKLSEALRPVLLRAAATYLLQAKGRDGKRALDPVAHFHLSNGARMEQLNWMGDTSAKGIRNSVGLMINYLYPLDRIERYHEDYSGSGKIAVSSSVSGLLK